MITNRIACYSTPLYENIGYLRLNSYFSTSKNDYVDAVRLTSQDQEWDKHQIKLILGKSREITLLDHTIVLRKCFKDASRGGNIKKMRWIYLLRSAGGFTVEDLMLVIPEDFPNIASIVAELIRFYAKLSDHVPNDPNINIIVVLDRPLKTKDLAVAVEYICCGFQRLEHFNTKFLTEPLKYFSSLPTERQNFDEDL